MAQLFVFMFIWCLVTFESVTGVIRTDSSLMQVKHIEARFSHLRHGLEPLPCSLNASSSNRNGIVYPSSHWKEFKVHLHPAYDADGRELINNALLILQDALPCINFTLFPLGSPAEGDFVYVFPGDGYCSSNLGHSGGNQTISLSIPGCMHTGIIVHEFIHMLGVDHEQCRSDRNDFVDVFYENIQPGNEYNFNIGSSEKYSAYGVPYNTKSIMHYGSYDISANGKPTILLKDGGEIGRNFEIQETDIIKLRRMYNCQVD